VICTCTSRGRYPHHKRLVNTKIECTNSCTIPLISLKTYYPSRFHFYIAPVVHLLSLRACWLHALFRIIFSAACIPVTRCIVSCSVEQLKCREKHMEPEISSNRHLARLAVMTSHAGSPFLRYGPSLGQAKQDKWPLKQYTRVVISNHSHCCRNPCSHAGSFFRSWS